MTEKTITKTVVSVPSRGIGCITIINIVEDAGACFRPLTGYRMHFSQCVDGERFAFVSVPSRGIGCIGVENDKRTKNT